MCTNSDLYGLWSKSLAIAKSYKICSNFGIHGQNLCMGPLCTFEWS